MGNYVCREQKFTSYEITRKNAAELFLDLKVGKKISAAGNYRIAQVFTVKSVNILHFFIAISV